jgi:hypothetical protein
MKFIYDCGQTKHNNCAIVNIVSLERLLEMGTLVGGVDRSTSKIEIRDDTFVVASSSLYFTLPYNTAFWYFNSWFRVE